MRMAVLIAVLLTGVVLVQVAPPVYGQARVLSGQEFSAIGEVFTLAPVSPGREEVPLLPGVTYTLDCPAARPDGGILCAPQYTLDVPAEATGLKVIVQGEADFLIFLRFNRRVELEEGRPILDLVIQSRRNRVAFALPPLQPGDQFPGLQAGRYYFAIAHFETAPQRFVISGGVTRPASLQVGLPATLICPVEELLCAQQFTLRVPDAATALTVEVQGQGDFVAFVRSGTRVEFPPLVFDEQGRAVFGDVIADHSASAQEGRAQILVDVDSSPPLQAGTYFIAVANLEDFDGSYQVTATVAQVENREPVAGFDFSPHQPRAGEAVHFTDLSSDPDGRIVAWLWDFGDGGTSTQQNPTHTYAAPGTYRVTLTVTDDGGASNTAAQTLTVLEAVPPQALLALAFLRLEFEDPAAWSRALEGGCMIYTNTSSAAALVRLTAPDGSVWTFPVPPGEEVIVCGNVAHLTVPPLSPLVG